MTMVSCCRFCFALSLDETIVQCLCAIILIISKHCNNRYRGYTNLRNVYAGVLVSIGCGFIGWILYLGNLFVNCRPTSQGATQLFFRYGCAAPISVVWGLRTDICLWKGGLVSGKFPNLGACELKISKFGSLWAKRWVKIEAVEAKISKFSQKGVLWTDSFAWNGTLASGRRGVKRGSSGPHIPLPNF